MSAVPRDSMAKATTLVAVEETDSDAPILTYHDPDNINTMCMDLIARDDAEDRGAVSCSQCFTDAGLTYDFGYLGDPL